MFTKLITVWLIVLITVVPYSVYYLLYKASPDQYAFLAAFIIFWIFGFWSIAGSIISIVKLRKIFKALENIKPAEEFRAIIQSSDAKEVAVELIASENRIPKFLAKRVFNVILNHLSKAGKLPGQIKNSFIREYKNE